LLLQQQQQNMPVALRSQLSNRNWQYSLLLLVLTAMLMQQKKMLLLSARNINLIIAVQCTFIRSNSQQQIYCE
jgi:hypothetical protein